MTFSELITEVANRTSQSRSTVRAVLGEAFEVIEQVVMDEEKVSLRNFGTFLPYTPPQRELFGGTRKSEGRRRIRFSQRRRKS